MNKVTLALLSLFIASLVFSHEYIFIAENFRVKEGDDLRVHLFVADGFNIEMERVYQPSMSRRFELYTNKGKTDLSSTVENTIPLIQRKVDFTGGGLIVLDRQYARINLATSKFFDYLKEDHLEGIAPLVDKQKPEQRERYTRYIKTLIQSGESYNDTYYKLITRQTFEIILLKNPYQLKTGDNLPIRVLFDGKPYINRVITARNRSGNFPPTVTTARTNNKGECSFRLTREGDWFIHATNMIPCKEKADSDWESFWTTYSFGIGRKP